MSITNQKTQNLQIRISGKEKDEINKVANILNENISEFVLNSVKLRIDVIKLLSEEDLDDENTEQYKKIVKLIVNNLRIN